MIPVLIIGAGPAGIAAAIQLRRSGIEFLLLEKDRIGGLLHEANRVENFPGIAGGVAGKTLASRLQRQLSAAGIQVKKAQVQRLAYQEGIFMAQTAARTFHAEKVILASGTLPLPAEPPLDQEQIQDRVFRSLRPLLAVRNKTIAVIGGGDAAFDYALSLAKKNQVHILMRSARPRALPLLFERCRNHPRITIHENSPITAATAGADEIVLKKQGEKIICQRVLTAIGRIPALHFLDPELRSACRELGRQKKLFLAGDVCNGRFRQAVIAAADGLRAAMEIHAGAMK